MSEELEDIQPDQATFEKIQAAYPNRIVARMLLEDEFGKYPFVITSPSKAELNKYLQEISAAGSDSMKARDVVERAAIMLVRWPERIEVQAIFEKRPALSGGFADIINRLSGLNAEATLKK